MANTSADLFAQPELFPDAPRFKATKPAKRSDSALLPSELVAPDKTSSAFKTISEAAKMLSLPQYVLRFWESKFKQIKPLKMKGGRRYYRPEDIETLATIKRLLYKEGYTIKGARKAFDDMRKGKKSRDSVTPATRDPRPATSKKSGPAPLLDAVRQSALTSLAETRKKQELESLRKELMALKKTLELN